MKILLMMLIVGGASEKMVKQRINPHREKVQVPKDIGLFLPGGLYPVQNFEFRPYRLHPSRKLLKLTGKERVSKDYVRAISLTREYGEIFYDFKARKAKIPNVAFNSYCEISFWKEVYPELKETREKIKELAKKTRTKDIQKKITQIKEEFHQKFLEKRIEVMEELGNPELEIQAQKAYQKYMEYKTRREK